MGREASAPSPPTQPITSLSGEERDDNGSLQMRRQLSQRVSPHRCPPPP